MNCAGSGGVRLGAPGTHEKWVEVFVVEKKTLGFDFILGMNGIAALGGAIIAGSGDVLLGAQSCCAAGPEEYAEKREGRDESKMKEPEKPLRVDGDDFAVSYDPDENRWLAEWRWSENEPSMLKSSVSEYNVPAECRREYEEELQRWVDEGWLVPYDASEMGSPVGLIPLMAVVNENKRKVRPVMDYRSLNEHVDTYTANADVCIDKIREWRKMGVNVCALDLKSAYLQIHVKKSLWRYQTVVFRGRRWALTRLGFGLNVSPAVMKAVLGKVLSMNADVERGTSTYIDDILVNEEIVTAEQVRSHLSRFGLVTKDPEHVKDGARLLGLHVWRERDELQWRREDDVGELPLELTRRSVFSICGKLLGHFPVCHWLRVAVAYIKRRANEASEGWDDVIESGAVRALLSEVVERVKKSDPVHGRWDVNSSAEAHIWVDASSIAIGVALEVDGSIVEDASWLRTKDATHINMAELDAVVKGLNLGLAWGFSKMALYTDSATVQRWVSDGLTGKARLKTKAASEMLIRRRVGIVMELVREYQLELSITLVPSAENKADALTRVPQHWLRNASGREDDTQESAWCGATAIPSLDSVIARTHHDAGHPGVRKTLFFVRRTDPEATKSQVRKVVSSCDVCRSIDPAPVKWKAGKLDVEYVWKRLGMDVTYYRGQAYLTVIDCGPSRFAIWRPLRRHTSAAVVAQLEDIFLERGAPAELLMDNDTAFRSRTFNSFLVKWGIRAHFRCAYVPSGNGIAERAHRTIKVIAARKECDIAEAVELYNATPRDGRLEATAPANAVESGPRVAQRTDAPADSVQGSTALTFRYRPGDPVWVRPPQNRCHTRYERGVITGMISNQAFEVDGLPRHVRDLRPRSDGYSPASCVQEGSSRGDDDDPLVLRFGGRRQAARMTPAGEGCQPALRRSERSRRQPVRLTYTDLGGGEGRVA